MPSAAAIWRRSVAKVEAAATERIGLRAIFAGFLQLGAISVGGNTLAWLYREIVQRRGWIDDKAFLSQAALSQMMPGSGGVNLVVLTGQQLRRGPGAVVAVLGLLAGPLAIVLLLAAGYRRVAGIEMVHAVLDGVAAAAVGLILATGLRLVQRGARDAVALAVAAATVLCVGVLRWPMLPVVLCLAPVSIGLARLRRHRPDA
jgi:chromate transporter